MAYAVSFNETAQENAVVKLALDTLVQIQQYVDTKRFSVAGLSRAFRRVNNEAFHAEIAWLVAQGYITKNRGADTYSLTQKGWAYEPEPEDGADGAGESDES